MASIPSAKNLVRTLIFASFVYELGRFAKWLWRYMIGETKCTEAPSARKVESQFQLNCARSLPAERRKKLGIKPGGRNQLEGRK
jgi:hypothetical protein